MARRARQEAKWEAEAVKPSLDGVYARLARAKDHFDELHVVLAEHDRANPVNASFITREAEEWTIAAVLKNVPEVPIKARVLIGEVVHAIACALDNLVFQLCLSHQIAIGNSNAFNVCDQAKTAFPIFITNSPEDVKRIEKSLRLMAPAPAEIIRRMQPYQRPDPARNPLWALYRLDVIDKHRVVLAVTHTTAVRELGIDAPSEESETIVDIEAPWQELKEGVELFRLTLPPGHVPKPGLKFNIKAARRILFAETNLCDGDNVLHFLKEAVPLVRAQIVDNLAPYVV